MVNKRTNHSVWTVLAYLLQQGSAHRSQIAQDLMISKASVSETIRYLSSQGLVVTGPATSNGSRRGRQTIPIHVNPEAGLLIGVDQAGGSLMVVVVDMALAVHARFEFPQLPRRAETSESLVFDAVDAVLLGLGSDRSLVRGIGVAVPGLVNVPHGVVAYSSPFSWKNNPLAATFSSRYRLPTVVVNDVNAMLVSEVTATPLVNSTVLLLYLGEGIGGALWSHRQLWLGSHFASGEWGHTMVKTQGTLCQCGRYGCVEAEYALPSVVQRLADYDSRFNSWKSIVEHQSDPMVGQELGQLADAVALAASPAIAFIDPDVVIIVGQINDIPPLVEDLIEKIRNSAFNYSMDRIQFLSGSQENSTALGAAYVAAQVYLGRTLMTEDLRE